MELAAFKSYITKKHEEEIKKHINDPPCELPGTYVGMIGTAVSPDWKPRDLPIEAICSDDENERWKKATNLPKPENLCSRGHTVAQNIYL